ncbi:MAG: hypothetical protein R3290_00465 [Acidimicrobiia bacterium]|nr:hypothetical protein [Acidimicrobiia bacterium]
MTCSRCGGDAVVKRNSAYYCGKCALARDWHEIIQLVQDARVETPVGGAGETPAAESEADPFLARA